MAMPVIRLLRDSPSLRRGAVHLRGDNKLSLVSLSLSRCFSRRRAVISSSSSPVKASRGFVPLLPVLKYPHHQLRAENEEVRSFDKELEKTARSMFKTMYLHKGVGLAAPQVGVNKMLIVVNPGGDKKKNDAEFEIVMANPKILKRSDMSDLDEESCLSIPLVRGDVERSLGIVVQYNDLSGQLIEEEFDDYTARIIQHEVDHLNKILFIDRMSEDQLSRYKARLDRYIQKYGDATAA